MKSGIPKPNHKLFHHTPQRPSYAGQYAAEMTNGSHGAGLRKIQQRYCNLALVMAVAGGTGLMLFGYFALGKGLILGALFSIINFILMGLALPLRLGKSRGKTLLLSLASVFIRYAVLAVPLIWALKYDAFAVSTAAIGLFMVQIAVLGDHLWTKWRNPLGAG